MSVPRRVIVTTVPFGVIDPQPLEMLRAADIECVINPLGRKLKTSEVADVIRGFPVVIAGTEDISAQTMADCPDLKAICRVGVGLDSVDLPMARHLGISVAYTPDGPAPAVAELAVGQMLALARGAMAVDRGLRRGEWNRFTGRRLGCSTVGVIGVGRIGKRVVRHLLGGFPGVRVLAHDIAADDEARAIPGVEWVGREELLARSDFVSLHVPLSPATRGLIGARELTVMKASSVLVNTARGGIVDEDALAAALASGTIGGAAVDVFEQEPYAGPLTGLDSALLTCHMGSMTADCRLTMEVEATAEAIRFLNGQPFQTPVPEAEYALAEASRAQVAR